MIFSHGGPVKDQVETAPVTRNTCSLHVSLSSSITCYFYYAYSSIFVDNNKVHLLVELQQITHLLPGGRWG